MHDFFIPAIPGYINDVYESIKYFMPEIYLSILFVLVFITDLVFGRNSKMLCKTIACVGMLVIIVQDIYQVSLLYNSGQLNGHFFFSNMLLLTKTAVCFKFIIDVLVLLLLLYFDWDHK